MSTGAKDQERKPFPYFRVAVLFLCLIEAAVSLILPEGLQTRAAREVILESVRYPAADLAIMGDSVAATGIDPNIVAAGLNGAGMSVGNYSIAGSSSLFSEAQLDRMLKAGCRPGAIIYARHPATLGTPMVDRYFGRFATFPEMLDALKGIVEVPDALMGIGCRLSYTLRYREEIRASLLDGDPGFFQSLYRAPNPWVPPVRGGTPGPLPDEPEGQPDFSRNIGPKLSRPIIINPTVDRAIEHFLLRAKAESIPVYWWILPTCESLAQLPRRDEGVARLEAYIAGLERKGLIVRLNPTQLVWPDRYFHDPWHLAPYGAAISSRLLVEALREKVKPGVPAFREVP
jgi:hypothetical protein